VVNPGPGSCIADGPIHMSPAVSGYPALLVDGDSSPGNFTISATKRALSEMENDTNYHPAGAAVSEFDSTQAGAKNDIYPAEIGGLIAIEGNLVYQNTPLIRGQVMVGGNLSNSSGTVDIQYQPESLLNPPPGFWAPYLYVRRPISGKKSVLP
jgi:hypothetical protein